VGENIKMRYLSYLDDFKCTGGSCEDNCCGGWDIHIDKSTFNQYENIQDKKMKKHIRKNIFIRNNSKNVNIDYAQIKLKYNNKCPFLDKKNQCCIQTKLGEEYLSDICTTYPRIINKVDDDFEVSLNISCIEAARIILLKEEGIECEEGQKTLGKYALSTKVNTDNSMFDYSNIKYIKEIRDMSIKIIKNRKYELSERLYMLGCFLEILRKELCYNYNNVIKFINTYNMDSFSGEFKRNNED